MTASNKWAAHLCVNGLETLDLVLNDNLPKHSRPSQPIQLQGQTANYSSFQIRSNLHHGGHCEKSLASLLSRNHCCPQPPSPIAITAQQQTGATCSPATHRFGSPPTNHHTTELRDLQRSSIATAPTAVTPLHTLGLMVVLVKSGIRWKEENRRDKIKKEGLGKKGWANRGTVQKNKREPSWLFSPKGERGEGKKKEKKKEEKEKRKKKEKKKEEESFIYLIFSFISYLVYL